MIVLHLGRLICLHETGLIDTPGLNLALYLVFPAGATRRTIYNCKLLEFRSTPHPYITLPFNPVRKHLSLCKNRLYINIGGRPSHSQRAKNSRIKAEGQRRPAEFLGRTLPD
jgi:hypothetical protein